MEINSTQTNANSQLKQEIELMLNPFSSIAIAKKILYELNVSGPLGNLIEHYWYEKGKIKTASIVSYGLKPLIKVDDIKATDSLYLIWPNAEKSKLKHKDCEDFDLLKDYVTFCVTKIRDIMIAFKSELTNEQWTIYSRTTQHGILSVTFINGILNVLRLLIQNNKIASVVDYRAKLKSISSFNFRQYKSSQYRKLGEDIYNAYFNK